MARQCRANRPSALPSLPSEFLFCSSRLLISRKVLPGRRLCQIDPLATRYVTSPGAHYCAAHLELVIDHREADSTDVPVTPTMLQRVPPTQECCCPIQSLATFCMSEMRLETAAL